MAVRIENECVDCGLPCIGRACPYQRVQRFYCDECGEEAELYYYDDKQLCISCVEKHLEKVESED